MAGFPEPKDRYDGVERPDRRGAPPGGGTRTDPRGPGTGQIGNPPHEFNPEWAVQITNYAAAGGTIVDIAEVLETSQDTIRRHYGKAWRKGKAMANLNVGNRIYQLAMAGNPQMCRFYAVAQAGWRDSPDPGDQPPTPQGGVFAPVQINVVFVDTPEPAEGSILPVIEDWSKLPD